MTQPNDTTRCGLVAIVGRPNVGKSTLLNRLLGQKVSITSRKPQTTRHRILGIDTEGDYQAIYVDTPGLHSEEKSAMNRYMNRAASSSLAEVGLVLFVIEGTRWNEDDEMVLSKVKASGLPCYLIVNKMDKVDDKEAFMVHLQGLSEKYKFEHIVPISAKQGKMVDDIRELVANSLPESERSEEHTSELQSPD